MYSKFERKKHIFCNFSSKISRYSPSEQAKIYEKAVQRHPVAKFHPKATIEIINEDGHMGTILNDDQKNLLLDRYLEVCISLIVLKQKKKKKEQNLLTNCKLQMFPV